MTSGRPRVRVTTLLVASCALLLVMGGPACAAELPDDLVLALDEARKANMSHDIERERLVLEHAEKLSGEPDDQAEVQRRLAALDWKYHARFDEARKRLLKATADGAAERAEAWIALARLEQYRERFDAAHEAAARGCEAATKEEETRQCRLARAAATVEATVRQRLDGKAARGEALRAAFTDLEDMVAEEPGYLEPSLLLLRAAVLLDEGPAALMAWRSYYHVGPSEAGPSIMAPPGRELQRLLPDWSKAATTADRVALARALGESRFFTAAALVALDPAADPEVRGEAAVKDLISYEAALRRMQQVTHEFYRQTAIGEEDHAGYKDAMRQEFEGLIAEISFTGERPQTDDDIRDALSERFGAYISIGRTAGYNDTHMGHRVIDETQTVEQYAEKAELRFVSLDHMVSNGFQSWAWESGAQHGGWAKPNAIYQVRPAYASGPLQTWRGLNSKEELAEYMEDMERESGLDDGRATEDPYSYLPGLTKRLRYQGTMAIVERLRADGLEGDDLRLAFLSAFESAVQASSIFAHEGRHAIDKRLGQSSTRSLEFTAKLSEAAFAPEPRLSLSGIFSPNIGDDTPHGQANLKIMKGLARWMKKNSDLIEGLDAERPLLPQFDLLTDDQIRVAFRSMDELAPRDLKRMARDEDH